MQRISKCELCIDSLGRQAGKIGHNSSLRFFAAFVRDVVCGRKRVNSPKVI